MTWIDDGCGNFWPDKCPDCGSPMQVVRPGDCRCSNGCERYIVHIMFPDGTYVPARITKLHLVENLHKLLIDTTFEVKLSPEQQVMITKVFRSGQESWYKDR